MKVKQTIPTIDLNRYRLGDASDRAQVVHDLGYAFEEFGFLAVENHGLDRVIVQNAYTAMKDFFALPDATKKLYELREIGRQRGYTPFGKEKAKNRSTADVKEFWHSGPEFNVTNPLYNRVPRNIWPTEVPTFKTSISSLYQELSACGDLLLEVLGRYLGAEEGYFKQMTTGGNSVLRMIRYPDRQEVEPGSDAVWAAAHEDINLITLLIEATGAGLQILRRDGEWMSIAPIPGQLIADTGDMMQRLTNGQISATTHRVLAPDEQNGPRYSMPFFIHPHPDTNLACLPQCVGEHIPARYRSISAEDYLEERLRDNGVWTIDKDIDWLGSHTIDLDIDDDH